MRKQRAYIKGTPLGGVPIPSSQLDVDLKKERDIREQSGLFSTLHKLQHEDSPWVPSGVRS